MNVKKRSQKQEKEVAKQCGGNVVIASGALWGSKGDVRTENCLIECKTTESYWYPFNISVWNKIVKEALNDSLRTPLMFIYLENGRDKMIIFKEGDFSFQSDTQYEEFEVSKYMRLFNEPLILKVGKERLFYVYADDFFKHNSPDEL